MLIYTNVGVLKCFSIVIPRYYQMVDDVHLCNQ